MPTDSPGARVESDTGRSSLTERCVVRRCGAAYSVRVCMLAFSKKLSKRALCDQVSWPMAVRRPSAPAPRRNRWMVLLRWVVK